MPAWVAFTLASALLMLIFSAWGWRAIAASRGFQGVVHGLKIVAVAIVAQAVWGHGQIAVSGQAARHAGDCRYTLLTLVLPTALSQIGAIVAWQAAIAATLLTDAATDPAPWR